MASTMDHVTLSNLKRLVSAIRPEGQQGSWCLGTDEQPFSTKQSRTFIIQFADAAQWAIRVPVHCDHLDPDDLTSSVETEVDILKALEVAGFKWSPKLVVSDSKFGNFLHSPYIVLNWVHGKPLKWSETVPAGREHRNKIIRQITEVTISLAGATAFDNGIHGYGHLINMIDRQICRVVKGQLPGISVEDCLMHRVLAGMAVDPHSDSRVSMTSHENLSPQNIIVDDEYNIQGIIDWGFARKVPLQFGLGYPRFLSIEPPAELNDPPPTFSREMLSEYFKISAVHQEDRSYCMWYLSSKTDILSQRALSFLSASNVDWRRHIFDAASSKGLHKWMSERSWLHAASDEEWSRLRKVAVLEEAEAFVKGKVAGMMDIDRDMLRESLGSAVLT